MTDIVHASGTAAVELFRRDLIATAERDIAACERALERLKGTLLGQGWIVRSAHGLCMSYTIDMGRVENPAVTGPATATRFTRDDAENVASSMRDGTGEPFVVVYVTDAIAEHIAQSKKMLADLKAGAKPSQIEGA